LEYAEGNLLHWQKLLCIFCSICSLQRAISGAVVATFNQRRAWRMEIPSHCTDIQRSVYISDRCYAISALRKATYQGWYGSISLW